MLFGGFLPYSYESDGTWQYNDTWLFDGHNWTPVDSPVNPPASLSSRAELLYDSADKAVLLMDTNLLTSTWEFANGTWRQVRPTGTVPTLNYSRGANPAFVDDASDGYVLLVNPGPCGRQICDTDFGFHGGAWRQLNISGTNPRVTSDEVLVFDGARNSVLMVGGYSGGSNNLTWSYHNGTWTHLHPATAPVVTYCIGAGTYDSALGGVLYASCQTIWLFSNGTWTNLGKNAVIPSRYGGSYMSNLFEDPANHGVGVLVPKGLWTYSAGSWRLMDDLQDQPYPTFDVPSVNNNELLVFDQKLNAPVTVEIHHRHTFTAVWAYTNGSWHEIAKEGIHLTGFGTIAYEPATGCLLTFGGGVIPDTHFSWDSYSNATWQWCGGSWTEQHWYNCTTFPQPMEDMEMTYDAADGHVVLFGGYGYLNASTYSMGNLNQTWEWSGHCWVPILTSSAPPAAASAGFSMAYDSTAACVLVFLDTTPSPTWCYSAKNWTQLSTIGGPAASSASGVALANDPTFGGVVLFAYSVLWGLANGTWTKLTPTSGLAPEPRQGESLIYDPAAKAVMMDWGTTSDSGAWRQVYISGSYSWQPVASGALGPWFWV